jgi:hypothetical protein
LLLLLLLLLAYLNARSPALVPLMGLDMSGLTFEEQTGTTDVMMIAQLDGFVDQKSERSDQGGKFAITNEQNETVQKIGW